MVPITEAALPLCRSMPILCLRNWVDLHSPETPESRLPISETSNEASPPKVSSTIGKKMYAGTRFAYLALLRTSASRAADPAIIEDIDRCVLGDGSETLVNARMEDDLLVVDRVSRRLMLRSGSAVVGVWNEAFDLDGVPPGDGTTVSGVQRTFKAEANSMRQPGTGGEQRHE